MRDVVDIGQCRRDEDVALAVLGQDRVAVHAHVDGYGVAAELGQRRVDLWLGLVRRYLDHSTRRVRIEGTKKKKYVP